MQFELKRLPERTDEAIIIELRRVSNLLGSPVMTVQSFGEHSKVSASTVRQRFGGWENALVAAGLSSRSIPITAKLKAQHGKGASKESLVVELQRIAGLLNSSSVRTDEFNAHSLFNENVVRQRFGSWKNALKAAKLEVPARGQRYSDDECFENLLVVWSHYGRPPFHREMTLQPSIVGPKAYVSRWGTWIKALHAFTIKVNQDLSAPSTVSQAPPLIKVINQVEERNRRDIRLGLRYTVFQRDRFRCIACGASPATSIECTLHVDHVLPFSKGGRTEIANLQTLCATCNLGKGARIENAS